MAEDSVTPFQVTHVMTYDPIFVVEIREKTLELQNLIRRYSRPGRRRSIALDHLEIACTFAVKSVTVGDA